MSTTYKKHLNKYSWDEIMQMSIDNNANEYVLLKSTKSDKLIDGSKVCAEYVDGSLIVWLWLTDEYKMRRKINKDNAKIAKEKNELKNSIMIAYDIRETHRMNERKIKMSSTKKVSSSKTSTKSLVRPPSKPPPRPVRKSKVSNVEVELNNVVSSTVKEHNKVVDHYKTRRKIK